MKPIYTPSGAAKEYGDHAINIYTGCPHRCYYCFAPRVLHRDKEQFHSCVEPRKNIVEETRRQIERDGITDKLIHLCFTCDPYPTGYDTLVTREIIKLLKDSGNHVQILTKGDGRRDFDLLDSGDWYGITISTGDDRLTRCSEPNAIAPSGRLVSLLLAKKKGIKTWVSIEPVLDTSVLDFLGLYGSAIDKVNIGKLNYYPSDINWHDFGHEVEALCQSLGVDYYIKDSLRKELEK